MNAINVISMNTPKIDNAREGFLMQYPSVLRRFLVSLSAAILFAIVLAGTVSAGSGSTPILIVEDFPQIEIYFNQEIEFQVTLTNTGMKYADAMLWFRDLPEGIEIIDNGGSKFVDFGKAVVYTVKMKANQTAKAGTYYAQICGDSRDAQRNWHTFTIKVISSPIDTLILKEQTTQMKSAPGFEAAAIITVILGISILRKKR